MKKGILFSVIVLTGLWIASSTCVTLQAAIPASERAALIAFYNATNGDSWSNNDRWKGINNEADGFSEIGSEGTWFGIVVSGDHVTEIKMYSNNLLGSIPPALGSLSKLKFLNLDSNFLSGSIPPELGNLSELIYISLGFNWLSNSIPSELGNLSNLKYLYLSSNHLSGSIPPELGNLSNLESLELWWNSLSGSIPLELGNLSNLKYLALIRNHLSGSIPPELGNLSNLSDLLLGSNQLSGTIPPELGNLSNLSGLSLRDNQLSGSIPPELGNLSNLSGLYLSNNQLSGTIPPELGNLSNMHFLDLTQNQLSSSISPELGNLSNLFEFKLSYNQLSGNIPRTLTNLTQLYCLEIRHNCLYTNDTDLRAWLNYFDPEWESYQCEEEKEPPFGYFETPMDGSTVSGSIPVTGWALDDSGIDSVKIFRKQGSDLVYIGDAILVEGARPDVAAAYPDYPNNTKAGWGYMLLTHFLPDSGNGTFVLHAIVTDVVGKTTTLGTKAIYCDNANAVKPFGANDTPTQGGIASGDRFVNWGWILTPPPNIIPTDGSTINVYVDGVNLGYPTYNKYRADIASLFPGYANSNGAAGFFYLDTTAYENGVHTIQWTATDSGGNSDCIGSRFFLIQNSGTSSMGSTANVAWRIRNTLTEIPVDYYEPVRMKKGCGKNTAAHEIYPDEKGNITIKIKELELLEVRLGPGETTAPGSVTWSASQGVGNQLRTLPIGSTLDREKGIFYWHPGPGFLGLYHLVFIRTAANGEMTKKSIVVEIVPKTAVTDTYGR